MSNLTVAIFTLIFFAGAFWYFVPLKDKRVPEWVLWLIAIAAAVLAFDALLTVLALS